MDFYALADSIEKLTKVSMFVAGAPLEKMSPWDAAQVLDNLDIDKATEILAAIDAERAAEIMHYAHPIWVELILDDMGSPWSQAIKSAMKPA